MRAIFYGLNPRMAITVLVAELGRSQEPRASSDETEHEQVAACSSSVTTAKNTFHGLLRVMLFMFLCISLVMFPFKMAHSCSKVLDNYDRIFREFFFGGDELYVGMNDGSSCHSHWLPYEWS